MQLVNSMEVSKAGVSEGGYLAVCSVFTRLLVMVVAAILMAGCARDEVLKMPEPRTVLVERVQRSSGSGERFSGQLQAALRSELAFETSGLITTIHVELGDRFEAGRPLAELEKRARNLELAARQANLTDARAELEDARLDYERHAALVPSGAVSQSAVDRAKTRFDSARARVDARRADVDSARERLADATLVAPFAGEVTARLAEPSEFATSGRPILRVIGTGTRREAVVNVPGAVRRRLERGQVARVTVAAQNLTVDGTITEIGAEANIVGLFPITIVVDDAPDALQPGEAAEARFDIRGESRSILIPLTAHIPSGTGEALVYVVTNEGEVHSVTARRVRLGRLSDQGIEITEGLESGELIVSRGADLLRDGEQVNVAGDGRVLFNL